MEPFSVYLILVCILNESLFEFVFASYSVELIKRVSRGS